MLKWIRFKNVIIYYILVLVACSLSMNVYGQLILMLLTTPIFLMLSILIKNSFNEKIKIQFPELFKKHVYEVRQLERLDIGNLICDEEFKKIKNITLKDHLKLHNQLLSLTFISFLILIVHAVLFMMFKYEL